MCKTLEEKLQTKLCPRTEGQTDSHSDSSIPPSTSLWGYNDGRITLDTIQSIDQCRN